MKPEAFNPPNCRKAMDGLEAICQNVGHPLDEAQKVVIFAALAVVLEQAYVAGSDDGITRFAELLKAEKV